MATITTNTLSLTTRQHQSRATDQLSRAIDRLSSGLRINSARDDAAGQAIANRMQTNLNADQQISRGMSDGISLAQTAEGGLDSINDLLQRGRELAVQAANGTLSDSDRATINQEFLSLRTEIDRISGSTEIFGKAPLAGEPRQEIIKLGDAPPADVVFINGSQAYSSGVKAVAYVPAGTVNFELTIDSRAYDDDIQLFTQDGKHLAGTPVSGSDVDYTWSHNGITDEASANSNFINESEGFNSGAVYDATYLATGNGVYDSNSQPLSTTYNGMTIRYSGDGDRSDHSSGTAGPEFNDGRLEGADSGKRVERVTIDNTTENLILFVSGEGSFDASATWDSMPPTTTQADPNAPVSTDTEVVMSADYGSAMSTLTIKATPSDSKALGIENTALDPFEKAREAMAELDNAILKVDDYRSQYGAVQNRLEGAIDAVGDKRTITAAAQSRIMDADYAQETSHMARARIISDAANAMLAQANQTPEAMLSLLK